MITDSEDLQEEIGKLRKAIEQENEDIYEGEKTIIEAVGHIATEILNDNIKEPEARGFFQRIIDKAKEKALKFLK